MNRVIVPPEQVEEMKNDALEFAARLCEEQAKLASPNAGTVSHVAYDAAMGCAARIRARKTL